MPNLSEAQITLRRLWPRLKEKYAARTTAGDWQAFHTRLETHFPRLLSLLVKIYPGRYDLYYHLEKLLEVCAEAWLARAPELKTIDAEREQNPRWFQSQQMLAGVCYVDLFAGNLQGLREKIPYFKELGLTYLHLMPLFKAPEGNSDGGYAVSSYREVNPALGNIDELRALAAEMRQNGISLCVDFIFNHTSDEHEWAKRALAGDPDYADFYFFFPDRQMPDAYERNVREIFPDEHPGVFSPLAQWGLPGNGWVWTTFHRFQWDLNYSNPAVFTAMAGEMLFIANLGVDVLRMDAVAFIWKRLGTVCENLPEAHWLIQAFNAVCRMAAPSLLFKSEAIVHPDDVNKYIHPEECQLSYNPLLMALLWNSLATRQVRLLSHSMRHRFAIHPDTAWVNYVRVHDDIGWTFSDEDAQSLGINGSDHRRFLNSFYTGRFPGSFARGLPFQENPKTGDCRISGTGASLAGLEQALAEDSGLLREHAVRRILLIHGVILSIGGLPLIYLGDELGQLNDYGYKDDHAKAEDSRWAHRPAFDWQKYARRTQTHTPEGRLYSDLHKMIELRRTHAVFAAGPMHVLDTGNEHVFGFERQNGAKRAYFFGNFSEHPQTVSLSLNTPLTDLITGRACDLNEKFELNPYELVWLE
jgi:amylosucrase